VNKIIILLLLIVINGCSSNSGRYQQANDSKPTRSPTKSELIDAKPRFEPKSRGGNKSQYKVRGKYYNVMPSAKNFTQTGIASWYGKKFHGHLTSNGEIYNMYSMSAAHKNLPLPTYVKVVNHANNKSVIVRVNDRGPFHQDRIIDLSYSAAYKLGMMKTGVAKVTITAINDFSKEKLATTSKPVYSQPTPPPVKKISTVVIKPTEIANKTPGNYIQVYATKDVKLAKKTAQALNNLYQLPTIYPKKHNVYRIQIGPIKTENQLTNILESLQNSGYPHAFKRK
jgi:rare lipoprotein A